MITQWALRKKEKLILGLTLVLGFTTAGLGVPLAQNLGMGSHVVVKEMQNGFIDWGDKGVIQAVGFGIPSPDSVNANQAREMAIRAATVVARRNLLEIVQGIRVDSVTTVNNYMVESDEVKNRVQGIIKNAKVIDKQEFPDGSWQVTVEMKLRGDLQSSVYPSEGEPPTPLPFGNSEEKEDLVYSGLVVMAKGLNLQESLQPKILMEDGRVVYGAEWVTNDIAHGQGLVGYVKGAEQAREHHRVTATPFEVTALKVTGENNTDLVIGDADAQTLHVVPEHLEFLKQARVVIVVD